MINRLVKVRWVDATHIEDDMTEARLVSQKLVECTTVGVVVTDNEQRLVIASTVCHEEEEPVYRSSLILPQQYITEITELDEATKHQEHQPKP